jgi:two-component system sensor histidine kinase KdpD
VVAGNGAHLSHNKQLAILRQLATDVGADWNEIQADDPARALVDFARDRQITQIVVGSSSRSRWQELKSGGSVVRKILRLAADAGIDVHIIARRDATHEPAQDTEIAESD